MKILLVSQDYPPATGGVQEVAVNLARQLGTRFDVAMLAPWAREAARFDRLQPFPTHRLCAPGSSLFGLRALVSLPRLARRRDTRVVIHLQHSSASGSLLARARGGIVRYYVCVHGRELLHSGGGPLGAALRRRILRQADGVFAVSRFTADLATQQGVDSSRLTLIGNGVDTSRFQPRDDAPLRARLGLEGRRVLLTVSRLVRRKGIDTVIAAMDRLRGSHPDLALLVAGDGEDRRRLEQLARPLRDEGRVIFAGRVSPDELAAYYSLAHVFALPARQEPDGSVEGFGLVFLEAGACGIPVIGAASGGIPDAVTEGLNGLLVPPSDPHALATAIARLLDDPALAARLGRGGMERASRFTWAAVAARIAARLEADAKAPRR